MPLITCSAKTAVLEQPLDSSFGSRHVTDGACPHDELVSPRHGGRSGASARKLVPY